MTRIFSLIAITLTVSCKNEPQPPTNADDPNLVKRVELLEQRVEQLQSEREMEKAVREAEKNGFRSKAILPNKESKASD